jgi:hypothetical protein
MANRLVVVLQPNLKMKNKKKEFLPQKICIVCQRPFTWRKKWEKVWDEVKYCSDKCRTGRHKTGAETSVVFPRHNQQTK